MDEQKKYEVIKELADHPDGNKDRAALKLGCTKPLTASTPART